MMDQELITTIRESLEVKSTDELRRRYEAQDQTAWSPEAFEAMRRLLAERGEAVRVRPLVTEVADRGTGYWRRWRLGWYVYWQAAAILVVAFLPLRLLQSAMERLVVDKKSLTWGAFYVVATAYLFFGMPYLLGHWFENKQNTE
jgi:hypothetical protein